MMTFIALRLPAARCKSFKCKTSRASVKICRAGQSSNPDGPFRQGPGLWFSTVEASFFSVTVRNLAYLVSLGGEDTDMAVAVGRPADAAMTRRRSGGFLSYVSLFTSLSTLLCCALPSLFVLLGLGATVASAVSAAPWLITFSRHKNWTFTITGLLILANFVYVYMVAPRLRAESQACPIDGPSACGSASRMSRWMLWISAGIYMIGFFSAYLLGPLLRFFE